MKKIYIGIVVVIVVSIFTCCSIITSCRGHNKVDVAKIGGVILQELQPVEYIELPLYTEERTGFTPTGITYCEKKNKFYIGNYGKSTVESEEYRPGIEGADVNFISVKTMISIDISSIMNISSIYRKFDALVQKLRKGLNLSYSVPVDVQGIAYDEETKTIWYTNDDTVINCDAEDGTMISSFNVGEYGKYKCNGICVDPMDDTLWVLCFYNYLLHYKKDGQLIEVYRSDYIGQDHICFDKNGNIYISVGEDYHGNNNYVLYFDKSYNLKKIYRVLDSYAIEGICIVGSDLYVVNDGYYHDAKIKKNYIQKYQLPLE